MKCKEKSIFLKSIFSDFKVKNLKFLLLLVIIINTKTYASTNNILSDVIIQGNTVSGVVYDVAGLPLAGVNILEKGTVNGTQTDFDGNFTINVASDKAILLVSYVGFLTQIVVADKASLTITLQEDVSELDEVVIIGYGTVKKSDLTGSVSSVKVSDLGERPIVSADQLIQGRAAGVEIVQNSGAPGAASSINIRGVSTINGSSQPLIVIDGFPMENENSFVTAIDGSGNQPIINPLSTINPNDIESIEVLKDASSTAIYGSRGANGVILITTKRGKRGGKVSYNMRSDIAQLPSERKINVLGTRDYLEYINIGHLEAGNANPLYSPEAIEALVGEAGNVNWQDEIYRVGVTQDHQISFTGADDLTNYAVVGGYSGIEGIIRNSELKRYSLRTNLSRQVLPWLKLKTNFSYTKTLSSQVNHSSQFGTPSASVVLAALQQAPIYSSGLNLNTEENFQDNPVTIADKVKNDYDVQIVIGKIGVDIKILPELTYSGSLNFNTYKSVRQVYFPRGTFLGDATGGQASFGQAENFNYLIENLLRYNKKIAEGHRIDAVFGTTYRKGQQKRLRNTSQGFINDNLGYNYLQGAEVNGRVFLTRIETELASFLGRVNYSIKGKYSFTLTGRYDGTSRLAEKWSFFPSGAVAWNMHKEKFLKGVDPISNMKLRASYGLSGRQSVLPLSGVTSLTSATAISGEAFTTAIFGNSNRDNGNLGNPNLKWETTSQLDIGFDLGLMKNRYHFTFDWFKKNTTDLLLNLPLPLSAAFDSYWTNLGEIENKGFEIELGGNIINRNFKWDVSGTYSSVRNKVLDIGGLDMLLGDRWINAGDVSLNEPLHVAMVGQPVGVFFGYKFDGIYQNQAEIDAGPETGAVPGDFKFKDIAGDFDADGNPIPDGQITPDDRTVIGNAAPDFTFGLTNTFSYKNLALSVFLQGSVGNEVLNLNRYISGALASGVPRNVTQEAFDNRWQGEGTSNTFGRVRGDGLLFNTRASDFLVEDASYVRIKNVTLSYNIPLKNTKIVSSAKVFVTGSNLFVFTNYSGYDPEVSSKNSPLEPGVDFGSFPQPRAFSIGANIEL